MNAILRAIFPPSDQGWQWRRRMAFAGCGTFLGCFVYAVGWLPPEWGAVVMVQSLAGWTFTMGIYYGGSAYDTRLNKAAVDDKLKRGTEAKTTQGAA